jgi:uncharacterized protein (TIRG00374 family)
VIPSDLRRAMLLSVGLGILVILGLGVLADVPRLLSILRQFAWQILPAALSLTGLNYVLRFVKWHYYLRVIGESDVPLDQSALIFTAGLSMAITPAKIGELLKSYLLLQRHGTPISSSAPIIVAERLTDGAAMLLLASVGLVTYGVGWQMLAPIAIAIGAVIVISQHHTVVHRGLRLAERMPIIAPRIHHLEDAIRSAHALFQTRNLLLAIGIGVISWGGEAIAFYLILIALGLPPSPLLAVQAAFILAVASLLGAASMLPGGLAAAESSLTGLLLLLGVTHDPALAAAATLLIRFATLWFGVAVGTIGLIVAASGLAGTDAKGAA